MLRIKGEEVREKHERERNNQDKDALAGRDNVGPMHMQVELRNVFKLNRQAKVLGHTRPFFTHL